MVKLTEAPPISSAIHYYYDKNDNGILFHDFGVRYGTETGLDSTIAPTIILFKSLCAQYFL